MSAVVKDRDVCSKDMSGEDEDFTVEWKVLLCADCDKAYGRSSRARDLSCPHCGGSTEPRLLSRHLNPEDAQNAISHANVPQEIRLELAKKMGDSRKREKRSKRIRVDDLPALLQAAANESGELDADSLRIQMAIAGIGDDAETFAEDAAIAGVLLNIGPGRWRILD
jgi:hypothetical protein